MKKYAIVIRDGFCEKCKKCGEKYKNIRFKWCKSCQVNKLKKQITNLSGNKEIDNFIQEMQLKINNVCDIIFEWIPYDQLIDITKIGKGGFATVFSAEWEDGPLNYNIFKNEYERLPKRRFALKRLNNTKNITNEFLNEVSKIYSRFIKLYNINNNLLL
jgi:hypothetical protein